MHKDKKKHPPRNKNEGDQNPDKNSSNCVITSEAVPHSSCDDIRNFCSKRLGESGAGIDSRDGGDVSATKRYNVVVSNTLQALETEIPSTDMSVAIASINNDTDQSFLLKTVLPEKRKV